MNRVHIRWQRKPSQPTAETLRRVIGGCLERLSQDGVEVHVLVTGDALVRELNARYLGDDHETDVLSFPDGDLLPSGRRLLGEIVISIDCARRQAEQLGHDELRELTELGLHGLLHLLGYDHEQDRGRMNRLELRLRRELLP